MATAFVLSFLHGHRLRIEGKVNCIFACDLDKARHVLRFPSADKMKPMKMDNKAQNVDAYIAAAPKEVQAKLNQIRAAIKQVAPNATEYISYGMPVFRYERPFIGFAAMKNHIGLYPMSGSFVAAHQKELAGYTTSKSAIQLPLDKPLPLTLIKKIVKLRIKETKTLV